jgi:hypothetical protein
MTHPHEITYSSKRNANKLWDVLIANTFAGNGKIAGFTLYYSFTTILVTG